MDIPCQLNKDELFFMKQVGRGGFGCVSLHKYLTIENEKEVEKLVAVKKLLDGHIREKDLKRLQHEAQLLWNLKCEHIINMVGLLCSENEFCVVMEYASNGSCFDFFRDLHKFSNTAEKRRNFWPLKCRISYEVIEGMKFLHRKQPKKILHLDLKSANVLLDENLHAKICDFGLSQMHTFTALSRSMTRVQKPGETVLGTITHIAPEHIRDANMPATVKSDMYSFGVFLWELATGETPYKYARNKQALQMARIINNVLPNMEEIPKDAPKFLMEMMPRCLSQDPKERPTFSWLSKTYNGDFEEFLQQADKSARIVLEMKFSAMSSEKSCHLEISTESRISKQIQKQKISESKDEIVQSGTVSEISSNRNSNHNSEHAVLSEISSIAMTPNTCSSDVSGNEVVFHLSQPRPSVESEYAQRLLIPDGNQSCCSTKGRSLKLACFVIVPVSVVVLAIVVVYAFLKQNSCTTWGNCENPAVLCPVLDKIKNGNATCVSQERGEFRPKDVCLYSCINGHDLIGSSSLVCTDKGTWSHSPPLCSKVCSIDHVPENLVEINCTGGKFAGSSCYYTCNGPHTSVGPTVRTCQPNGQWSNPFPTCKCPVCKYGDMCDKSLLYSDLFFQLARLQTEGQSVQLTYGEHKIFCETDIDFFTDKWTNKYDCTCWPHGANNRRKVCKNRSTRQKVCGLAVGVLLRALVMEGVYEEPCDLEETRKSC